MLNLRLKKERDCGKNKKSSKDKPSTLNLIQLQYAKYTLETVSQSVMTNMSSSGYIYPTFELLFQANHMVSKLKNISEEKLLVPKSELKLNFQERLQLKSLKVIKENSRISYLQVSLRTAIIFQLSFLNKVWLIFKLLEWKKM